ncbi:EpsG family protein [Xenorhabdus bovienii]|uniref:EpsG family protein n=1 Tax=Xenorhabdus bovienii TaxID=40576 RepID=UPI003DA2607C
MFIIYALIAITLKIYVFKKISPYIHISILLYYSNYYFLHEMTQIRIGAAIGILFLSLYHLIHKNNKILFIIGVLIASSFHYSALLFIVILILPNKKISIYDIIFYTLCITLSYFFYYLNFGLADIFSYIPLDFVKEKFLTYQTKSHSENTIKINVFNILQLIRIVIVIIFMSIMYKTKCAQKIQYDLVRLYALSTVAWVSLFNVPAFAIRISELFSFSEIILIPFIIHYIKQKKIAVSIIIFISALMFYISIFHNNMMEAYKFFWN